MLDLSKVREFECDSGNIDKSYKKHGVTAKEAEELFLDEHLLFIEDVKHSQEEERFIVIGRTFEVKILFAVFIIRKDKIRVISARVANKKERRQYEKKT